MKYVFIELHRSNFRVSKMCRTLKISRSAFYSWRNRSKSKRELDNEFLLERIKEIHRQSKQIYGSPKIFEELKAQNIQCGKNRVARIMRKNGIKSKRTRKFKATTNSNHRLPIAPNLLNQVFSASKPNEIHVSDITYIPTGEGWLYLAVVIDLYSRQVVGWCMSERATKELVYNAVCQAIVRRKPKPGLIFHSDRGVQYASHKVRDLLKNNNMLQSMSKKGDCYDNAVAESFFAILKTELVYFEKFKTRDEAKKAIFEFIEIWYNRKRLHSKLKYLTPVQFEKMQKVA